MPKVPETLIKKVAAGEDAGLADIKKGVRAGAAVVLKNSRHKIASPCAVGAGLRTKVNANIGASPGLSSVSKEMRKMDAAVAAGADALMDLTTGPLLRKLRKSILASCPLPLGTVPVYELACEKKKNFMSMDEDDFLDVLRKQAEEGVDFFTIHSGITLDSVRIVSRDPRIMNIVSRGGALLASWMLENRKENPFFSRFDDILEIAAEYSVVLSLGDSLRPGALADATDRLQIQELLLLGELQQRALARGVQVMIEGPGHVPLDQIEMNVKLQKSVCHGAPFYVLGPLVTDAAPGYDHIVGAIGGAIAAWHGADFLCYVTPAEHLCLPGEEDVRRGVMASRIAAHAADIVKGIPSAAARDRDISRARARRDWNEQFRLALDSDTPRRFREASTPGQADICTMCLEFCSIKTMEESLERSRRSRKR